MKAWGVLVLGVALAAGCNVVTGAGDLEIGESADDDGAGGDFGAGGATGSTGNGTSSTGSGSTGAETGSGSGSGSGSGTGSGSGSGGGASTGSGATTGAGGAATSGSGTTTGSGMTTGSGTTTSGGGENCGGSGPGTTPLDSEEQAFLVLINNYRQQNGRGPLDACVSMNRAAQGHSEDMRDQDYFDHDSQNGDSPFDRMCSACFDLACNTGTAMGENIAAGNSGAQATFDQWRNSPGHNANMLSTSFNYIGIGRATGGGTYGTYWTNVFAGDDEPSCY